MLVIQYSTRRHMCTGVFVRLRHSTRQHEYPLMIHACTFIHVLDRKDGCKPKLQLCAWRLNTCKVGIHTCSSICMRFLRSSSASRCSSSFLRTSSSLRLRSASICSRYCCARRCVSSSSSSFFFCSASRRSRAKRWRSSRSRNLAASGTKMSLVQ